MYLFCTRSTPSTSLREICKGQDAGSVKLCFIKTILPLLGAQHLAAGNLQVHNPMLRQDICHAAHCHRILKLS